MSKRHKFSEKIAHLMQKQAEEAKAFERILREVQPITSGHILETESKAHVRSEDNIGSTWTQQNECTTSRYTHSHPSNQYSYEIPNQLMSSICSTNSRDYDEKMSSSDAPWKWADPGSASNEALVSSLVTDCMPELPSEFAISSEPLTSTSVSHNLVPQATRKCTFMAETDPSAKYAVPCHYPNSTLGFSPPKIQNATNSFLQSHSISTSYQSPQQQIPIGLLHNQTHENKIQACDQLLEMFYVECDTTSSIF